MGGGAAMMRRVRDAALAAVRSAARSRPTPPAVAKTHRNLLPLFVVLVCITYIDRTAVSFAALQLCRLEWFNARVFGLGAAAFTASYTALQVPSNLVLQRVGAKAWLPAITAAWGAVSVASAAIRGPASFLALRALLGAAEAGCFPAMWAVCGEYYPPGFITFAYAAIEAAIALAQVLAAPLAAALLSTDGRLAPGLAGWQALFVFQGAATVVFAAVLRAMLPRDVDNAHWLTAADRAWIREARGHAAQQHAGALQGSSAGNGGGGEVQLGVLSPPRLGVGITEDVAAAAADVARLLPQGQAASSFEVAALAAPLAPAMTPWQQIVATARNRRVWLLVALKALKDLALDALVYWTPVLVHALLSGGRVTLGVSGGGVSGGGVSGRRSSGGSGGSSSGGSSGGGGGRECGGKDEQLNAVLLTLIPFGLAAAASLALGHSSEVTHDRKLHIALPLLLGGAVFALMPLFLRLGLLAAAFACVTAAVVAADATTGPFWTAVLTAAGPGTSAVALAAVNSLGKLGGAAGPAAFGVIAYHTGSYAIPVLLVAGAQVAGGVLALFCVVNDPPPAGPLGAWSSGGGGGGGGGAGGDGDSSGGKYAAAAEDRAGDGLQQQQEEEERAQLMQQQQQQQAPKRYWPTHDEEG